MNVKKQRTKKIRIALIGNIYYVNVPSHAWRHRLRRTCSSSGWKVCKMIYEPYWYITQRENMPLHLLIRGLYQIIISLLSRILITSLFTLKRLFPPGKYYYERSAERGENFFRYNGHIWVWAALPDTIRHDTTPWRFWQAYISATAGLLDKRSSLMCSYIPSTVSGTNSHPSG